MGGGGGSAVRERQIRFRKNCGKIAGKLRENCGKIADLNPPPPRGKGMEMGQGGGLSGRGGGGQARDPPHNPHNVQCVVLSLLRYSRRPIDARHFPLCTFGLQCS